MSGSSSFPDLVGQDEVVEQRRAVQELGEALGVVDVLLNE
jgi:hypothetical protein